tara:strand:+ start:230 stop:451 length:222 start_codon:yes stop_codon:yes gene_type:complete
VDQVKPSRPKKVRTKKVQPPLSKEDKELFEEKPNKYAPKMKVGKPAISTPGQKVTSVGLGNLKVITVNGNTNV